MAISLLNLLYDYKRLVEVLALWSVRLHVSTMQLIHEQSTVIYLQLILPLEKDPECIHMSV